MIVTHFIWETTMNISKRQKRGGNLRAIVFTALAMGLAGATNAAVLVGPDITVRFGDLPIETEQGATKLLQRIERAAQRVCAPVDHGTLDSRANAKACRQGVTAAAVSKVNHPMLHAAYNVANCVRPPVASLGR
jgi:UrcA family protein